MERAAGGRLSVEENKRVQPLRYKRSKSNTAFTYWVISLPSEVTVDKVVIRLSSLDFPAFLR